MARSRTAVVAIGGNSLIKDPQHQTVPDQYAAVGETVQRIVPMVADGWSVVVTHGNGPQIGFILRRSELAAHELHEVPLDVCGADTQGAIGYMIQQHFHNEFQRRGLVRQAVTVVTQVEVDPGDPAFQHPTKPIGSFMDEAKARQRQAEGWTVVQDAGRGWRRVVPSPRPRRIVEVEAIRRLLAEGFVVIGVGGGGIPVVRDAEGNLRGVAAVIDKDLASSLLATLIGADLFVITTAVPQVALHYGRPEQQWLSRLTVPEARRYLAEGHFGQGSMAPKIEAVIGYLERGGREAIITDPPNLERALAGDAGTRITLE
ncbi:MAG: carbamate kinase [Armatimonadota bacterium]|nr:carbamate kinase [Armatimonadota bacterium]MDR7448127.1 carbamate kinase [Armatimonadota bacterium]MDR7460447.1 carbamate kinase [Armatimonadota bacterium]MDR7478261.1 carbamate kinase [Armatimonadota bacterium]MDR7487296.1 carbamate kinase [Armatimonadota bacterium]